MRIALAQSRGQCRHDPMSKSPARKGQSEMSSTDVEMRDALQLAMLVPTVVPNTKVVKRVSRIDLAIEQTNGMSTKGPNKDVSI